MPVEIFNVEQGSAEWFALRAGKPTASEFSAILARGEGKQRAAYMRRLAAEIITGEPLETFKSPAMDRGHAQEDAARRAYALLEDVDPERVGFMLNDGVGYSPDSLIGAAGLLEIKTQRADLLIETWKADRFPPEHVAQCQGGLLVSEREWIDLAIYAPGMPMFVRRAVRDERYIANLSSEIERFFEELDALVSQVRRFGRV
jgi:hypothetical protein